VVTVQTWSLCESAKPEMTLRIIVPRLSRSATAASGQTGPGHRFT